MSEKLSDNEVDIAVKAASQACAQMLLQVMEVCGLKKGMETIFENNGKYYQLCFKAIEKPVLENDFGKSLLPDVPLRPLEQSQQSNSAPPDTPRSPLCTDATGNGNC